MENRKPKILNFSKPATTTKKNKKNLLFIYFYLFLFIFIYFYLFLFFFIFLLFIFSGVRTDEARRPRGCRGASVGTRACVDVARTLDVRAYAVFSASANG
jgi:cellulose synthase/poly-beta-1,6-N-acetylglucosamine synthase-like glycosyltransferase